MTSYVTATLAAARNGELHRRGARPLPLSALDAIRSSRGPNAAIRYFLCRERALLDLMRGMRESPRRLA